MAVSKVKRAFHTLYPLGTGRGKVIVAGMPKSGTTAIASLLAKAIDENVCSDPFHRLDELEVKYREHLFAGDFPLSRLWRAHRDVFSGTVVKDPNFPFFLDDFESFLPEAKRVFIVRNPFDNIRSILNRLELPADPLHGEHKLPRFARGGWFHVLNGVSPDLPGNNYLEKMAWRWRISAEHYLKARHPLRLIRYEDFRSDKVAQVRQLAADLGFKATKDISGLVDIQYQPRGDNSGSYEAFFGEENLSMIEQIVGPQLEPFGYGE
ncbi:MAG: sulfotransferase [Marinobacter sp.]|uniref:sulfotransferase n=1 Tax=Marinobacter sp. TaxID=50741 RepID=UPI0032988627